VAVFGSLGKEKAHNPLSIGENVLFVQKSLMISLFSVIYREVEKLSIKFQ